VIRRTTKKLTAETKKDRPRRRKQQLRSTPRKLKKAKIYLLTGKTPPENKTTFSRFQTSRLATEKGRTRRENGQPGKGQEKQHVATKEKQTRKNYIRNIPTYGKNHEVVLTRRMVIQIKKRTTLSWREPRKTGSSKAKKEN